MSGAKRRSKRGRAKPRVRPDPDSFWREDEPLERPNPLVPTNDPTLTLRSIGAPPVAHSEELLLAFGSVVKRASGMSIVLAQSVGLTADDRTDA